MYCANYTHRFVYVYFQNGTMGFYISSRTSYYFVWLGILVVSEMLSPTHRTSVCHVSHTQIHMDQVANCFVIIVALQSIILTKHLNVHIVID